MTKRIASVVAAAAGLLIVASAMAPASAAQNDGGFIVKAVEPSGKVGTAGMTTETESKLPAVELNPYSSNPYILSAYWDNGAVSPDVDYSVKVSIDGSDYKEVDLVSGYRSQFDIARELVEDKLGKQAFHFTGKLIVSYEVDGVQSPDSEPLIFTASGEDEYNLYWIG